MIRLPAGVPGGAHKRSKRAKALRKLRRKLRRAEEQGVPEERLARLRAHMESVLRCTPPTPRPKRPAPPLSPQDVEGDESGQPSESEDPALPKSS